eukprot:750180-Hanusia_phi.AAC.4
MASSSPLISRRILIRIVFVVGLVQICDVSGEIAHARKSILNVGRCDESLSDDALRNLAIKGIKKSRQKEEGRKNVDLRDAKMRLRNSKDGKALSHGKEKKHRADACVENVREGRKEICIGRAAQRMVKAVEKDVMNDVKPKKKSSNLASNMKSTKDKSAGIVLEESVAMFCETMKNQQSRAGKNQQRKKKESVFPPSGKETLEKNNLIEDTIILQRDLESISPEKAIASSPIQASHVTESSSWSMQTLNDQFQDLCTDAMLPLPLNLGTESGDDYSCVEGSPGKGIHLNITQAPDAGKTMGKSKKKKSTVMKDLVDGSEGSALSQSGTPIVDLTETVVHGSQAECLLNATDGDVSSQMECCIVVDGKPNALKRPRHLVGGHTYDPNTKEKKRFLKECGDQLPMRPWQGAMSLTLEFHMPRPKAHFSARKASLGQLKESAPIYPAKVPDLDNLVKFVLDALNEKLYQDDKQICEIVARKIYQNAKGEGRTIVYAKYLDSSAL